MWWEVAEWNGKLNPTKKEYGRAGSLYADAACVALRGGGDWQRNQAGYDATLCWQNVTMISSKTSRCLPLLEREYNLSRLSFYFNSDDKAGKRLEICWGEAKDDALDF